MRSTWAAAAGAAGKQEKKAPVAKVAETKVEEKTDNDDVDLFGDDDEEDSVSLLFNRKLNKHSFLYLLPIGSRQEGTRRAESKDLSWNQEDPHCQVTLTLRGQAMGIGDRFGRPRQDDPRHRVGRTRLEDRVQEGTHRLRHQQAHCWVCH